MLAGLTADMVINTPRIWSRVLTTKRRRFPWHLSGRYCNSVIHADISPYLLFTAERTHFCTSSDSYSRIFISCVTLFSEVVLNSPVSELTSSQQLIFRSICVLRLTAPQLLFVGFANYYSTNTTSEGNGTDLCTFTFTFQLRITKEYSLITVCLYCTFFVFK